VTSNWKLQPIHFPYQVTVN